MGGDSLTRGGQPCFGRRPKKNREFRIKIGWTTLRKRSKSMVFAEKIWFSKRKILKFRACTPQKPKIFAPAARLPPGNFQIYRRLSRSLHMHKTFLTVWLARWDLIIFDLRAATALSTHAQKCLETKNAPQARKNWNTRAKTIVSGVKDMEKWLKYSKK